MLTVEGADRFLHPVEEALERGRVGDVDRVRGAAQLGRGALGERGVEVADRDPRARADQRRRRGATDPPGGAGDRDDPAGDRPLGHLYEVSTGVGSASAAWAASLPGSSPGSLRAARSS